MFESSLLVRSHNETKHDTGPARPPTRRDLQKLAASVTSVAKPGAADDIKPASKVSVGGGTEVTRVDRQSGQTNDTMA